MLSGISLWQLLIVLVIVIMLFGTKRIRSLGSDLGGAFKGFRDAVKDGAFAYAKGDWGTFYDDMQCLLSECGADDQAAVDTEERYY